jgi:signal transduction histidine kinase
MRSSIKSKLMGLSFLASASAVVLACAGFLAFDVITFRNNVVRNLSAQAEIVGLNSASALLFGDVGAAYQTLSALSVRQNVDLAGIYTKDAAAFALWQREGRKTGPLPALGRVNETSHRFQPDAIELFHPIMFDGSRIGTVYIRSNLTNLEERRKLLLVITLGVLLLSLMAAGLISIKLGRKIADPVLRLADTMNKISKTRDYSVRAVGRTTDEIGLFVDTFNGMLEEIQTNHEHLEHRVRQRTLELEASNNELEAFSYSVSHDLRAPLRSIDGFSMAVMEDFGDKLNDEGKRMLERIRAATQNMAGLIDALLNLGRITRSAIQREKVDLSQMCRSIVDALREAEPNRRVEVDIADGAVAEADPRLVRVALENLIANAWKFTSKEPEARIGFGRQAVEGGTAFFVRDNGAGFDMAYANKLFRPFQRLHPEVDFKGTGVGLATVHRVIARHGGRVWAESAPGKGATFFFTL